MKDSGRVIRERRIEAAGQFLVAERLAQKARQAVPVEATGRLGLAVAGVHWFDISAPKNTVRPYWIDFTMNYTVFGYFATLCILSGMLFGIAPALRSSKPDLIGVLKEKTTVVR